MIWFNWIARKLCIVGLTVGLLFIFSGCGSSEDVTGVGNIVSSDNTAQPPVQQEATDLELLQAARAKWDNQDGKFYTIDSQRFCFCIGELAAPMKVSVSDDAVLAAIGIESQQLISNDIQQEVKTVDSLFELIEKAITDQVLIEVEYNEEYGYPESAKLDLNAIASDGGLHITLSNLEIKESQVALGDVVWYLESFGSIAGPRPIIENSSVSLSFDSATSRIVGVGGCNDYSADIELDNKNQNITISNLSFTEKACDKPAGVMEQEQNFFATLQQVQFVNFDQNRLDMVVGGDAGLSFLTNSKISAPVVELPTNDLAALEAAMNRWEGLAIQYYTVQSIRSCECVDEASAQMQVTVLDNSILTAVDLDSGEAISDDIQQEIKTVDDLFKLIANAIEDQVLIEVIYNEKYGYPESAQLDLEQIAVDGGLDIRLSNLQVQRSLLALDDVTWNLEAFDNIAGAKAVIENSVTTLSLDMTTMQISGSAGCNAYTADILLDDESHDVTISNIFSTDMACTEPENIMQQEQEFLATLEQTQFFRFDNAMLHLVVGADAGLQFVAAK